MSDVTLIQCTKNKKDKQAPARDLYDTSQYFRLMRDWATSRGGEWYILSAKHGLLDPDTIIEPYDERGISDQQAIEIATELSSSEYDTVHITAGRDYTNELVPELEKRGIDVINHFAGLQIGERMQQLKESTHK